MQNKKRKILLMTLIQHITENSIIPERKKSSLFFICFQIFIKTGTFDHCFYLA